MIHAIDYIWYKLYRVSLKSDLKKPQYLLASMLLATCLLLNIFKIMNTLFIIFNCKPQYGVIPKWIPATVTFLLALFLFLTYRSGRGKEVVKRYHHESERKRRVHTGLTVAYFAITILSVCAPWELLFWSC